MISCRWRKVARALAVTLVLCLCLSKPAAAHPHYGGVTASHPYNGLEIEVRVENDRVSLNLAMSIEMVDRLIGTDWRSLPLPTTTVVDVREEQRIREAILAYANEHALIEINGVAVKPQAAEFKVKREWNNPDRDQFGNQNLVRAVIPDVHVTLAYLSSTQPRSIKLTWEVFPKEGKVAVLGAGKQPGVAVQWKTKGTEEIVLLTEGNHEFHWQARDAAPQNADLLAVPPPKPLILRVPVLSVLAGGVLIIGVGRWLLFHRSPPGGRRPGVLGKLVAGFLLVAVAVAGWTVDGLRVPLQTPWKVAATSPPADQALKIFQALHRHLYRAFDYRKENDVYDSLAYSLDGKLLESVYQEIYGGLILPDGLNTVCRIQEVKILNADVLPKATGSQTDPRAFSVRCTWQVLGAVYHAGHAHFRTNQYSATYTVAPRDERWKIVDSEVRSHQRIAAEDDLL